MKQVLKRRQGGTAAIETAIILPLMITILSGLFIFWQAFQAQQVLTRTTGDAARAAHALIVNGAHPCSRAGTDADASRNLIRGQVEALVHSSLANHMPGGRRANIGELVEISEFQWECGETDGKVSWHVRYQMPLLLGNGLVALLGFDNIRELTESSTVHYQ